MNLLLPCLVFAPLLAAPVSRLIGRKSRQARMFFVCLFLAAECLADPFTDAALSPDRAVVTAACFAPDGQSLLCAVFGDGQPWSVAEQTRTTFFQIDLADSDFDTDRVFETELGMLSVLLCYDMEYPEPSRIAALKGADMILCPAAWSRKAAHRWRVETAANALFNLVYVAGANFLDENCCGDARIVGPDDHDHIICLQRFFTALEQIHGPVKVVIEDQDCDDDHTADRSTCDPDLPVSFEVHCQRHCRQCCQDKEYHHYVLPGKHS